MNYKISEIANIIGGKLIQKNYISIQYLLTDSRSLSFAESTLFFAIKTPQNDGHKFIIDLYQKGVRNFVISELKDEYSTLNEANFIVTKNVVKALQTLAQYHRSQFNIPIVGITGSNGKTIVKEWLQQLLKNEIVCRSPKSFNSQIGVPLSIWELNKHHHIAIFEAGISQIGEMDKLAQIIRPTIGIFTNIGEAHQENFKSIEEKVSEKAKLFTDSELVIFNKDNKLINNELSKLKAQKFSWSREDSNANLFINSTVTTPKGTEISFTFKDQNKLILIPFFDQASIENAINCLAFLLATNRQQDIVEFSHLESISMRLDVKKGINNCSIINDSYNSDFNSLNIALDFLSKQSTEKGKSRTIILSDILESGENTQNLYRKVAELLKQKNIDKIIGIGKDIYENAKLFPSNSKFYETTEQFISQFAFNHFYNETILLKGARKYHFEEILSHLENKFHETVMEVNLSALIHNFNYAKSKISPSTKIVCMIKASAYGTGSIEVAKALQHQRCDYFAVAFADEGIELRKAGITTPIMVLNPEKSAYPSMIEYQLEPNIYSFDTIKSFSECVTSFGLTNYPIHLKIDTGMHRVGFIKEEVDKVIEIFKNNDHILIKSVFSHLAGSDESKFDEYTQRQLDIFAEVEKKIRPAFEHHILFHILNSAGIERFSNYHYDMVRLGIGLYGISCVNDPEIQNVCSLRTIIQQIRTYPETETIGYSRKGVLNKPTRIGVIPIGYADGFDRRLSNRHGYVLINGKKAPVVGNICMDIAMIDLNDIPEAQLGDEVTIFNDELTLNILAQQMGTIPYEVLTGISERIKRIYFQE